MHTVLKPFGKMYLALSVCSRLISSRGVPGLRARLLWRTVDGDGGGGWSKKKFSDFAQNFFRWSSGHINVPPFRFLWRHVFKWKKIRFEVRNFRNFSSNSLWVIGVFLQVWIFSRGLTWHVFWNHELWNFLSPNPTPSPTQSPTHPPNPHTPRPH